MRILYIITGLGMGGAERQVVDLADSFNCLGNEVAIIALTGEVICKPANENIKVFELGLKKNIFSIVNATLKLRKLVLDFKPDVVHSHMVHANIFTRLLRLIAPVPVLVCTAHNTEEGGWLRMLAYRLTDSLADISTNVSHEAVISFVNKKAVKKGGMIVVYNGIDIDRFKFSNVNREVKRSELALSSSHQLLLAVGRFDEAKDYPNLLKAFSQLIIDNRNLKLAIIGTGYLKSEMMQLCIELSISENVIFLGRQNNVHEWMSAADCYVLSSAWEGFGLVVAEAMACERVVVATDCGGVAEVLGSDGYLCPIKDSESLAKKIQMVLGLDDVDLHKRGVRARNRIVHNYSLSNSVAQWKRIYRMKLD